MKSKFIFLAFIMQCTGLFAQTANQATLDTPAERERIRQVCMAETQAFLNLDYDGWAAAHYQGEGSEMSWNSPEGAFNHVNGWANMTAAAKAYMQSSTKDAGKLTQSNYSYLIVGNMAHVGFDQYVADLNGKASKSRQYRTMLHDAQRHVWEIVVMNAFMDYPSRK